MDETVKLREDGWVDCRPTARRVAGWLAENWTEGRAIRSVAHQSAAHRCDCFNWAATSGGVTRTTLDGSVIFWKIVGLEVPSKFLFIFKTIRWLNAWGRGSSGGRTADRFAASLSRPMKRLTELPVHRVVAMTRILRSVPDFSNKMSSCSPTRSGS